MPQPITWNWTQVNPLHPPDSPPCDGDVYHYVRRHHPPGTWLYERCIALTWCTRCRQFSGAMVHVPAAQDLPDPLHDLDPDRRAHLLRSDRRLLDHLVRLARRGQWPPAGPTTSAG